MKIEEVVKIVQGKLLTSKLAIGFGIEKAFSSDLMSDVLRIDTNNVLLITGLSNIQTIRTAEMADITCVIIARGKSVTQEMLELAIENEIAIIATEFSVFYTSGLLYQSGVNPIF